MQEGKEEHYKQRINGMSPYRSYDFSFKVCESLPQQAPLHERAFLAHLLSSRRPATCTGHAAGAGGAQAPGPQGVR